MKQCLQVFPKNTLVSLFLEKIAIDVDKQFKNWLSASIFWTSNDKFKWKANGIMNGKYNQLEEKLKDNEDTIYIYIYI